MDDLWTKIAPSLLGNGPIVLMLLYAVKWMQGNNRELIVELQKERDDRLTLMEDHMAECDKDRRELRTQVLELLMKEHLTATKAARAAASG